MTINEIKQLSEGMRVDKLEGKLVKIWKREEKVDKKNRPYTLQNGEVQDGSEVIRVSFWNHKDLSSYQGESIMIKSIPPKSFVSVSIYKEQVQLSVPERAIVQSHSEATDDIPYDQPETPKPQQNAPKASTAPKKAIPENGVDQVKHRVMQYSNLRHITDAAVDALYGDINMGDEVLSTVSSCFFIQACKEGLLEKMPNNKPIASKKPKDDSSQATDDLHEADQPF